MRDRSLRISNSNDSDFKDFSGGWVDLHGLNISVGGNGEVNRHAVVGIGGRVDAVCGASHYALLIVSDLPDFQVGESGGGGHLCVELLRAERNSENGELLVCAQVVSSTTRSCKACWLSPDAEATAFFARWRLCGRN